MANGYSHALQVFNPARAWQPVARGVRAMTDHLDHCETHPGEEGAARSVSRLAWRAALAGAVVLTVAGGWAYDRRVEYRIAYGQLFGEVADACRPAPLACASSVDDPGCCHDD